MKDEKDKLYEFTVMKLVSLCIKNRDLPKSGKSACQKLVARKIKDLVNPSSPTKLFPDTFSKNL